MSDQLLQDQAERQAHAAEIETALIRAVMRDGGGRRFAMSLLFPALNTTSYVPMDPLATAFNEGRRSVALELLARLDLHAPEYLLLARREELEILEKAFAAKQQPQETTNG